MKKINCGLSAIIAMALLAGCADKTGKGGVVTDKQSIADLNSLMAAHPEFSTATLKSIKNAAQGDAKSDTANAMDLNFALAPQPPENAAPPINLDSSIAKKAQNLIDAILDNFDIEAQMNAEFKTFGIYMNMQREFTQNLEKLNLGVKEQELKFAVAPSKAPVSDSAPLDTGKGDFKNAKLADLTTCEQIVDKPFGDIPKEKITALIKKNHEQLKATISGCAKIQGKPFTECIEIFNKMATIVNENANCSMKDFKELTKIAEKEFNKSFLEIQNAGRDCMNNQFSQCGFTLEKTDNGN